MADTSLFFWSFFLLQVSPSGFSDVLGRGPVQASAGEDVLLSCVLDPPLDVTDLAVQWKLNGVTVHLYTKRTDSADDLQDEQFRGRTSMFHHELSRGKISLKLTNVKKEDAGLYSCYVPRLDSPVKRGNVLLRVHSLRSADTWKRPEHSDSSEVVGHGPVQVTVGGDVLLSCHLEPPLNIGKLTVEWTVKGRNVHVHRTQRDDDDLQDEQFRGRTSLFSEELVRGNISLKLTNVREEDAGLYSCYVPKLQSRVKRGNVLLTVSRKNQTDPQNQPGSGGNTTTENGNKQDSFHQIVAIIGFTILAVLFIIAASVVVYFVKKKTRFISQYMRCRRSEDTNL